MDRPRIRFLPTFFTILAIVLAVAVVLRIHTYAHREDAGTAAAGPTATASGTEASAEIESPPAEGGSTTMTVRTAAAGGGSARERERERERERSYEQLLHQPLPAAGGQANHATAPSKAQAAPEAAGKAPQKPSLLSRIVAPIVNAFSGTPPAKQPQQSATATTSEGHDPKDPNSDTTPPQFQAIEFNPASVADGESTLLTITATDDLSGIASIAGNVISPSGALQGFALQRDGETNRYVSRIAIPKSAAEGMWHINYLSLTDKAGNTASFSYSQGMLPPTAAFRVVSSNADSTPPTLRAVWLDRVSMKAGEKNTVFVQADDDKSGVNLISGVFLSPAHFARVGFGCRLPDGADSWSCDFIPPANSDCGDWQLEQIQLQDKANNMIAVRRDNPLLAAVHLAIVSDQCDSHPPVVDAVSLDRYATAAPGTIIVRVSATDDISGVSSVSGHFVFTGQIAGTQPPKLWFACSSIDPQTWSGPVTIPDKAAVGLWRLEQLQVLDKANNLKIYTTADGVVANVSFRVQ
jgi:hypothetical protein